MARNDVFGNLSLIDDEELCLGIVNPIEPDEVLGMVNIKDSAFVLELESQFRSHWEDSASVETPL